MKFVVKLIKMKIDELIFVYKNDIFLAIFISIQLIDLTN